MKNVPERSETNALVLLQARLGSSIRARRQGLRITQEELAWRASLHRTYIADVERGVRNVTLRTVGQLAQALEVSVGELLAEASAVPLNDDGSGFGEILLIEDNPIDAQMAMRALRLSKLRNPVRVLDNGEAALAHLLGPDGRRGPSTPPLPQLILLDLHLPMIDGIEVLRRIRAERRTQSLPVAVLTVSDDDRDVAACRELGVEHYILKPVTAEALGGVVVASRLGWALMTAALGEVVHGRLD